MASGRPARPTERAPSPLARRWPWLIRLFGWYVSWFIKRHFHGLRVAERRVASSLPDGPVIIAINHPSWWDPLVAMVLAGLMGPRRHVAPMDASALEQYRFFERLGLFGIEPGTAVGLRRLVQVARQTLQHRDAVMWLTPQGSFADVRQRPLALQPGVGVLAHQLAGGTIVPVAIEYPFWNERLPEILVRFGEPIAVNDGAERTAREWTQLVEERLTATQDALREQAVARDAAAFEEVVVGRAGVSWLYDLWRRARAWWRGESFSAEHGGLVKS